MNRYKMVELGTLIHQAKTMRCGDGDYPVLSMTMHDGLVFLDDKFKKAIASKDKSDYKVVKRNQLVISFPIDEGVLATQRIVDAGIVSPAYGIWDINQERVLPEFLEYALRCDRALNYYKAKLRGSTARRRSLPTPTLLAFTIPLPGISEQQHILEVIRKVKSLISCRTEEITELDNLIKARFVEMFGDVIHNNKSWQMHVFADIASSRLGKMLDAKQQTGKCSYPYLANFNVQWFRFNIENLNQMDFDEDDRAEFELKDGALLVCEGGEIGRCAVWHNEIQPCFFQKALHRVRCNRQIIHPDYLAWWFKYNCDHDGFAAIAGAKATIAHLPGVKLKQLQVAVPPLELQEQFAAFVEQVDKSKVVVQKALDEAQTLFDSLMQEYFG